MEVLGNYSNLGTVQDLRVLAEFAGRDRPPASGRRRQVQRRLRVEEQEALIKQYKDGATLIELASQFGVHKHTVSAILARRGVATRRGLGRRAS